MEREIFDYLENKSYIIDNNIHVNLYENENDNDDYYKNELKNLVKISKYYTKYIEILLNENKFEGNKFHQIQNPSQKQVELFELNQVNSRLINHIENENSSKFKNCHDRYLYTLFYLIEIFHLNKHNFNLDNIKDDDWIFFDNYWRKIYHFMFRWIIIYYIYYHHISCGIYLLCDPSFKKNHLSMDLVTSCRVMPSEMNRVLRHDNLTSVFI